MAVSKIEEKILGRLAKGFERPNALLHSSLLQVLGLSIRLNRRLYEVRKYGRVEDVRGGRTIDRHHAIIWLAREGLSITEVYILPYCQNGEQGSECRVMAAKLRASFYHIFCLFHNHPPIKKLNKKRSSGSDSSPGSNKAARRTPNESKRSPPRAGKSGRDKGESSSKRAGKAPLRDPIPSMVSGASYVTNPFAAPSRSSPYSEPSPLPTESRRTPNHPPGLAINISAAQQAASFLLPPLNFVPMAREYFDTAHSLASRLLPPTHALRLSVSLERAAFLWDCEKDHERAKRLARRTIREVYASTDGLDDEEFADASTLVQTLAGYVKRGSNDSTPQPDPPPIVPARNPARYSIHPPSSTIAQASSRPTPTTRSQHPSLSQSRLANRTPERLSTVPEVTSTDGIEPLPNQTSPTISNKSTRSRPRRTSSTTSDKASKRRALEQAEEAVRLSRQNSIASSARNQAPSIHSRASAGNMVNNVARDRAGSVAGQSMGSVERTPPHSRQSTPPQAYAREVVNAVGTGKGKGKGLLKKGSR